ncbi:MAG: hypothetical protein AB1540_11510 [Bdellovibrionota bacterium]
MKFKPTFIILPLAFMLAACGSDEEDVPVRPSSVQTASVPAAPGPGSGTPPGTSNPAPSPSPSPGGGVRPGCGSSNAHRRFDSFPVTGIGNGYVDTPVINTIPDQVLRVAVRPDGAGRNTDNNGSATFNRAAMRVSLLQNGSPISSQTIPLQITNGNEPYSVSIPRGVITDPMLIDFSSPVTSTSPGASLSIRISEFMSDYQCNTVCNLGVPGQCYNPMDPFCTRGGFSSNWNYVYDYHTQRQWQCCGTNLDVCQRMHCGVGAVRPNSRWNVTVFVETEDTTCIPN